MMVEKGKWFKSSFSNVNSMCVEVRFVNNEVLVRDSKTDDPAITYTKEDWDVFIKDVKAGHHDLPEGLNPQRS